MNEEQFPEKGARILVVDDEEVIHVSLKRILSRHGHTVDTTLSAHDGIKLLETQSYDMVITDLMMPEMNGIELLEELKSRSISLPILMITGYPTIKTALQALRLGAVDYLAKPFTRTEVLAPVNRALRRQANASQERSSVVPEQDKQAEQTEQGEDTESFHIAIHPNDRFRLRRHSWVVYQQDGTVEAGIEASFLNNIEMIESIELPDEASFVEQGYIGIRIKNTAGEVHGVLMPLSGRIVEINSEIAQTPNSITPLTWLVRILPDRLQTELPLLVPG